MARAEDKNGQGKGGRNRWRKERREVGRDRWREEGRKRRWKESLLHVPLACNICYISSTVKPFVGSAIPGLVVQSSIRKQAELTIGSSQ